MGQGSDTIPKGEAKGKKKARTTTPAAAAAKRAKEYRLTANLVCKHNSIDQVTQDRKVTLFGVVKGAGGNTIGTTNLNLNGLDDAQYEALLGGLGIAGLRGTTPLRMEIYVPAGALLTDWASEHGPGEAEKKLPEGQRQTRVDDGKQGRMTHGRFRSSGMSAQIETAVDRHRAEFRLGLGLGGRHPVRARVHLV